MVVLDDLQICLTQNILMSNVNLSIGSLYKVPIPVIPVIFLFLMYVIWDKAHFREQIRNAFKWHVIYN